MSDTDKASPASKSGPKKSGRGLGRSPGGGLGRGLSSLLGDAAISATLSASNASARASQEPSSASAPSALASGSSVRNLPVEWINPGPWQPRRIFDQDGLQDLANSMREQGLIQPILVRSNPDKPGRYQIIAGERRWRAAQIAHLHEIPALIREMSDKDAAQISIIENIQRRDLSVIEEANAYQSLIDAHGYKQQEVSEIIGKSRSHIANLLRLLGLPLPVQKFVADGALTMGQVRPLIGHKQAEMLARHIIAKNLSARAAEDLAKTGIPKTKSASQADNKSTNIKNLEQMGRRELGLSLALNWKEDTERGSIKIAVRSLDEFEDILKKLGLSF